MGVAVTCSESPLFTMIFMIAFSDCTFDAADVVHLIKWPVLKKI